MVRSGIKNIYAMHCTSDDEAKVYVFRREDGLASLLQALLHNQLDNFSYKVGTHY